MQIGADLVADPIGVRSERQVVAGADRRRLPDPPQLGAQLAGGVEDAVDRPSERARDCVRRERLADVREDRAGQFDVAGVVALALAGDVEPESPSERDRCGLVDPHPVHLGVFDHGQVECGCPCELFPDGSLSQVSVDSVLLARLAFGRAQLAFELTPDVPIGEEMEQLRAFSELPLTRGVDFGAIMDVPLLALSPAVLGFLVPSVPHVLVFCFGSDVDLRRPYPTSYSSLYRPNVLNDVAGLDRSAFSWLPEQTMLLVCWRGG